ncbi:hypothetical protein DID78_05720 [Candidatus Marinamargulisbacteria bacterium SCGC AG-343-D04]|nr:hypothetical protein DID78_05720 [Candidatus Marinamargulisbacteria bacterium SCGC AG-343-D04]
MSVSFYLFIHITALVGMVSSLSYLLLTEKNNKKCQMIFGSSALLMLISGFGQIAKLGINMHSGWLAGKILIWLILAASIPMISKRFPHLKGKWFNMSLSLVILAVFLVVYKPF